METLEQEQTSYCAETLISSENPLRRTSVFLTRESSIGDKGQNPSFSNVIDQLMNIIDQFLQKRPCDFSVSIWIPTIRTSNAN